MAFIVGSVLIGAGASVVGGALSAKGQRDAAKTAAAGGQAEIEFNRESRDLVREDQKPYREAGYKALDALQSLVGLGGGAPQQQAPAQSQGRFNLPTNLPTYKEDQIYRNYRRSGYSGRAAGGNTVEGEYYNINELGPESVYSGGEYTRTPNPQTISGKEGYVQPNIKGRALGGAMGWGGPRGGYGDDRIGGYGVGQRGGPTPKLGGPTSTVGGPANTTAINPDTGYPNENPGGVEGGYQFQTEPGYQFRFSEGMRALDRGAAARGGLLSGGYARKAIRYGQGFASNEFTNVYNRIANIAGLGQTANQASGNAALYSGAAMGNAASNAANASAYGQVQAGNAWANAGNQIAQLPWGNVFNRNKTYTGVDSQGYGGALMGPPAP